MLNIRGCQSHAQIGVEGIRSDQGAVTKAVTKGTLEFSHAQEETCVVAELLVTGVLGLRVSVGGDAAWLGLSLLTAVISGGRNLNNIADLHRPL